MKFIGQFIQDFIARFRNDVYLEDLTEAAQDHVVGVDAAGKLYKQDVSSGDMTGVDITVGTGLDISQSNTTGGDYTSTINLDLTEVGVSGSADQLLTDDGNGTVTSESEAKITTQGGLSRFLKNAGSSNFLSNTSSNASFNLYEDVVFYDPTNNTKTNRGMFVNLIKGINAHFTSGTLTQIAGQFGTSNPSSTDTGATINQTGLAVSAVGNTTGTSSGVGIDIDVIGSDVNSGITITTTDGSASTGHDIKISSSVDTADFFSIRTFGSGETEITTVDSDGDEAAHLTVDIDGDITLDADGGTIEFKDSGTSRYKFLLDSTPEIDITGNFTLDCTGTIEINADGNSIMFKDGATEIMEVTSSQLNLLSQQGITFEGTPDANETTLAFTDPTADRTITLPDATGTVQLQGSSTGQTFNVPLKVDDLYILYVTSQNYWFHTGYVGQNLGTAIGSEFDSTAMRAVSYVAPSACRVNKVVIAFYMTSGPADLEFQVTKIPLVDGSNSNVTLAAMTHNDINFTASANYNYVKTMTMTGASDDNHLSAGQAFTLAVRQTASSSTRILYGNCFAEVELT
jgi:hypothetical protein